MPTACLTCDAAGARGKSNPLTPLQSVLVWLGVKGEMHGCAALTLSSGFTTERKNPHTALGVFGGSFRGYSFIATNDFAQQSVVSTHRANLLSIVERNCSLTLFCRYKASACKASRRQIIVGQFFGDFDPAQSAKTVYQAFAFQCFVGMQIV